MTLILVFEHKLIFYKPGILRFALLRLRTQLPAEQGRADRHRLLSLSLKHAWTEAKAQPAEFQRVRAWAPAWRGERSQQAHHDALQVAGGFGHDTQPIRDRRGLAAIVQPEAASTALACSQLH